LRGAGKGPEKMEAVYQPRVTIFTEGGGYKNQHSL